MEEVLEATQQGLEVDEAPNGRASRVVFPTTSLPSHLADCSERIMSCLDEAQTTRVIGSLTKFALCFPAPLMTLGDQACLTLYQHWGTAGQSITTMGAYPGVIETEICIMLKLGVVESTSSPLASPTVFVCKMMD